MSILVYIFHYFPFESVFPAIQPSFFLKLFKCRTQSNLTACRSDSSTQSLNSPPVLLPLISVHVSSFLFIHPQPYHVMSYPFIPQLLSLNYPSLHLSTHPLTITPIPSLLPSIHPSYTIPTLYIQCYPLNNLQSVASLTEWQGKYFFLECFSLIKIKK